MTNRVNLVPARAEAITDSPRGHWDNCASLCTNFNGRDNSGPCEFGDHECWCPDGDASYKEYQALHPEATQ